MFQLPHNNSGKSRSKGNEGYTCAPQVPQAPQGCSPQWPTQALPVARTFPVRTGGGSWELLTVVFQKALVATKSLEDVSLASGAAANSGNAVSKLRLTQNQQHLSPFPKAPPRPQGAQSPRRKRLFPPPTDWAGGLPTLVGTIKLSRQPTDNHSNGQWPAAVLRQNDGGMKDCTAPGGGGGGVSAQRPPAN